MNESTNIETLSKRTIELEKDNEKLRNEIEYLKQKLSHLQNILYGSKSEKLTQPETLYGQLFDEIESSSTEKKEEKEIVVKEHKRKKGTGRKPIPEWIERKEHEPIDIKEEEKVCGCGCNLVRIGVEKTEKLEIIPPKFLAHVYTRYKYGCKACEGSSDEGKPAIKAAPPIPQLIPKSIFTTESLAYIIVQKFCDGLPLYRICGILERYGFEISRTTLSNNVIEVYNKVEPILQEIHKYIINQKAIQIDESRFRVMGVPGKSNTTNSQMWVMLSNFSDINLPAIYYHYESSRSAEFLKEWLGDFEGLIQTDGWQSYQTHLRVNKKVKLLGCNVHCRRNFMDILKNVPKHELSKYVVTEYEKIYRLESFFKKKKFGVNKIEKYRQKYSLKILSSLRDYLTIELPKYPERSYASKAISYFLNNYEKLIEYVYHGNMPPDTNSVENSIRNFAVGRKNWLFAGSENGANASSCFYTLIENAKLCGINPYEYLKYIFKEIEMNPNYNPATLTPQAVKLKLKGS